MENAIRNIFSYWSIYLFICNVTKVNGGGVLYLYRPKDITSECTFSNQLNFDITFGMGLSDTITLILRNLDTITYECSIEIVTKSKEYTILLSLRFPTNFNTQCELNREAFVIYKRNKCRRLCDFEDLYQTERYVTTTVSGRLRLHFISNSTINTELNADIYQITATSARKRSLSNCYPRNESTCTINNVTYCYTSGVVCDGIKNCGINDWFDEHLSKCSLPVEKLGYAPVIAVIAAVLCAIVAIGHILMRLFPPITNSFFIFNANEDNRLCLDSVYKAPDFEDYRWEKRRKTSVIPVLSSSSFSTLSSVDHVINVMHEMDKKNNSGRITQERQQKWQRKKTMFKSMTETIQKRILSIANRGQIKFNTRESTSENAERI
ncbi:uncharacterized protein LOC114245164 [Bombyx mandarina]|uniref:CUB domain-containing protein n=2 Tax=Bombyx TaxID=7090 RepID=A0A8R2AJS0_BOMMO|nr:uncharacterized protein LOC101742510 [Bombyx mori]XP_028033014.1 uncharacterized protein LOC114245164 [Bombyx mandarina]